MRTRGTMALALLGLTAALAACGRPGTPQMTPARTPGVLTAAEQRELAAHAARARDATLAVYAGAWDGRALTLTRVADEEQAAQALILATLPATSSGPTGTTMPMANTVLLHQTATRSLDGACNAAPYGDPGVPAGFQGVCVNVQAINGYASSEVVRTYVEVTSLNYTGPTPPPAGTVTTYVKAPSDADFGTDNTRGLWSYDRLAAAGTPGALDRRAANWYFRTTDAGASATFNFVLVVRGQLVAPIAHATASVGMTTCAPVATSRPAVSADGRYVAFVSNTTGCFGGTGGALQVLRLDRLTGAVDVVSHVDGTVGSGSNGVNTAPSISDDGALVAWRSTSTNLIPVAGTDALGCVDGNGATASIYARHYPGD